MKKSNKTKKAKDKNKKKGKKKSNKKSNDEEDKYLMTFQNFIARVPKWNAEVITKETQRILERSSCSYLPKSPTNGATEPEDARNDKPLLRLVSSAAIDKSKEV